MASEVRWHHGQTLAAGQVVEFKVWAELVRQSMGGLHVFLPLRDQGIDGVLHRLAHDAYVAVQVKGRTELTPAGQVHITLTAGSLVDDGALIVATLVDGELLGGLVLVIEEGQFRELAAHDVVNGREYLTAAFELRAGGRSPWAPFGVFASGVGLEAEELDALEVDRGHVGFLGEAEVIRRLAEASSLSLFRPFPDLETVEVLTRHVGSQRFLGLQVKTAGWDPTHLENRVYVRRSSFRPAASTFVCVLAWDRETARFGEECLLIPSMDIGEVTRVEGAWLVLELEPGSVRHRRLQAYSTALASLAQTIESILR